MRNPHSQPPGLSVNNGAGGGTRTHNLHFTRVLLSAIELLQPIPGADAGIRTRS